MVVDLAARIVTRYILGFSMLNIFRDIHAGPLPPLTAEEADLSQRLRRHVDLLARVIGERNIISHPHNLELAAAYIEKIFDGLKLSTGSQPYTVMNGKAVRNIDAEMPGTRGLDEILIVGAHYDSIFMEAGCPGANDNASGVAATLEIARLLRPQSLRRAVRFVAFVNEEPPFFQTDNMGSLVYARRCRERNEKIIGMITPETIGCYSDEPGSQTFPLPLKFIYPNVGNFIAFVGNGASHKFISDVTNTFRATTKFPAVGFAAPKWVTKSGWSDHWSFWQCGYSALMATDTAPLRYRYYHTPQDTPEKLDYDRMARVVAGLARVVANLADEEK
jgi:Zn-dependent M28 family amino/carboxypeptidase